MHTLRSNIITSTGSKWPSRTRALCTQQHWRNTGVNPETTLALPFSGTTPLMPASLRACPGSQSMKTIQHGTPLPSWPTKGVYTTIGHAYCNCASSTLIFLCTDHSDLSLPTIRKSLHMPGIARPAQRWLSWTLSLERSPGPCHRTYSPDGGLRSCCLTILVGRSPLLQVRGSRWRRWRPLSCWVQLHLWGCSAESRMVYDGHMSGRFRVSSLICRADSPRLSRVSIWRF